MLEALELLFVKHRYVNVVLVLVPRLVNRLRDSDEARGQCLLPLTLILHIISLIIVSLVWPNNCAAPAEKEGI